MTKIKYNVVEIRDCSTRVVRETFDNYQEAEGYCRHCVSFYPLTIEKVFV